MKLASLYAKTIRKTEEKVHLKYNNILIPSNCLP